MCYVLASAARGASARAPGKLELWENWQSTVYHAHPSGTSIGAAKAEAVKTPFGGFSDCTQQSDAMRHLTSACLSATRAAQPPRLQLIQHRLCASENLLDYNDGP